MKQLERTGVSFHHCLLSNSESIYDTIFQMSQCSLLYIDNPPTSLITDRQNIYGIFKKFGDIFKVFCDNDHQKYIKVYYFDHKSALNAFQQINNKPPNFLKLSIRQETVSTEKFVNRNRSSTNHLNSSPRLFDDCSSISSNMGQEEFDATLGSSLYDIFGNEISIFRDENDHAYVSIDELKRHNFPLFDDSNPPAPITEEDYLRELKVYLTIKLRKFHMTYRQHTVTSSTSSSLVNQVINDYKNSKPLTSTLRSQNASNSPNKLENRNVRKPLNGTFNDSKENNAPNTENSSRTSQVSLSSTNNIVRMPINKPVEVSVTYGVNERRCYVYLKSRESNLRTILRKVEIEAKKSSPAISPVVGGIYAAIYEGEWYRAVVQSVNPLKVQYIDFGNCNDVPLKEVRHLSEDLCNYPWESICINFGRNPVPGSLEYGSILNVIAIRENSDYSYQVKKASEQNNEDRNLNNKSKNNRNEDLNKNVGNIEMRKLDESKINEVVEQMKIVEQRKVVETKTDDIVKVESSPKIELKALKQKLSFRNVTAEKKITNPPRNTIVEVYNSGSGLLQYVNTIGTDHIIFVLLKEAAEKELEQIENFSNFVSKNDSFGANLGDTVAICKEEDKTWARGTVIDKNNNNYHVALIDYGTIEITNTVYELVEDLINIGEFCCVCNGSEKFLSEVKAGEVKFEVLSKNSLKTTFCDGSTEEITCTRWDPFPKNIEKEKEKPKEIDSIFMNKPKRMELINGDLCKISNILEGKLLVKTRDCLASYKKLINAVSEYKAKTLNNPTTSQIALCSYKNSEDLHRVVILNIYNTQVEVEYLDLGTIDNVNINSLKTISESLATSDVTIIQITLLGYEESGFNEDELKKIHSLIENSTIFNANLISTTPLTYDLISETEKESLSTMLKKLGEKNDRFLYEDLPKNNKTGNVKVVCLDNSDSNAMVFVDAGDQSFNQLHLIMEAAKNFQYDEPYVPVEDEICFATFEDEWYRARVLEADPALDQFKVVFIDYGNKSAVSSANIRKINDDLKNIPNITMICKMNDLNGKEVTSGQQYNISILNKDKKDVYTVDLV